MLLTFVPTVFAQVLQEVAKPKINATKVLDAQEVAQVRAYLNGKMSVKAIPYKNDYVDEFNQGTVKFNPATRKSGRLVQQNYSYMKVDIPNGTTITGANFTQKDPDTDAISGTGLTFIDCQLINVRTHPTWTLIRTTAIQRRRIVIGQVAEDSERTRITVSTQFYDTQSSTWGEVEQHEEVIWNNLLSDYLKRFNTAS